MNLKLPTIPPWEPKWGTEALRHEANTNPRAFNRGFKMQAYNEEELMFPHFKSCYSHGVVVGDLIRRNLPVFVGVDLAGERRPGNAIVAVGLDVTTQRRILLEVIYGAWKSPETAGMIAGIASRHPNLRYVMVENNAYQQSLIDWVRHSQKDFAGWWHKIEAFTTGKNKADQTHGLPSLEVEFNNRAWVIPADEFAGHPAICLCGWCTLVREVTTYPRGATSDGLMALWFAREAIHKWGGVSGAGGSIGSDFNSR